MPVVPSNPQPVTGQVGQVSKPSSTQSNFRQMVGEVLQWNPDAPFQLVQKWLNNAYRSVIDRRNWYGLMVRGQVSVPSVYTTGTVSVTNGQTAVVGVGTAWDNTFVGRQFRTGFTTGWQNVASVTDATHLTLDLPWGGPTSSGQGYQIAQVWVSLGYNVKYVLEMLNQRQGFRLFNNWPQRVINEYDTWRVTTGWTFAVVPMPPSADGQPMFELYPSPTFQQAFPFIAYVQPQDMVNDSDSPVLFVRSDVLVKMAIADALIFRGKANKYYDPHAAQAKRMDAENDIQMMMMKDNDLYMKDLVWDYSKWPFSQHGSMWMQSHAGEGGL